MIELHNVVKVYENGPQPTRAVRGISLTIRDGEWAVLLGASGSGKSTLLALMSGLEQPTSGRVIAAGEEIGSLPDRERTQFRRRHVGFVFQQYYLLPELSVEANVRLGADLAGNRDYRRDIAAVGLEEKMKQPAGTLSGGQQQRVAIARALAKRPDILFLDEPTGALDEAGGREVLSYLEALHRKHGFTVVMVTHNEETVYLADRIFRLRDGRLAGEEPGIIAGAFEAEAVQ